MPIRADLPSPSSRRSMLRAVAGATAALTGAGITRVLAGPRVAAPSLDGPGALCRVADVHQHELATPFVAKPGTALKLTWNANAICTVGVPVAEQTGIFKRHGLDVETINFGGSTDQLLEAISTGKADAGVGMALRWLKPLEQGFDVKISTAIHGGCMRLFAKPGSGIEGVADLRGKIVGCSDMAAPDKNFFSIVAAKQGIDPNKDIQWRQFPGRPAGRGVSPRRHPGVLAAATRCGWVIRERDGLREIGNNLTGEYAAPRLLRARPARQPGPQRPPGRRRADAGTAGGAGLRDRQPGRERGGVRQVLAGTARAAGGHAAQPHARPPSDRSGAESRDRRLCRRAQAGAGACGRTPTPRGSPTRCMRTCSYHERHHATSVPTGPG